MLNIIQKRNAPKAPLRLYPPAQPLLFLLLLLAAPPAHAATNSTDCAIDGSSFYCRLLGILHILYALAAVLGVILVVIAVVAYVIYRRNRARKLDETRQP